MKNCECCRYWGVIDVVRWGLYGVGGVAIWVWYGYLDQVSNARSLASLVPKLASSIENLYYGFMLYPVFFLFCFITSLALAKAHRKFLATVLSMLPLIYLMVLFVAKGNLQAKAIAEGKEIFKQELVKQVGKLIPKNVTDKIPAGAKDALGEIGKKLF